MTKTKIDGAHPVDLYTGARVREERIRRGYTQSDLAQAIGTTFQQIQKYEKGRNRISASKLWDIACFLKVRLEELFPSQEPVPGPRRDNEYEKLSARQNANLIAALEKLSKEERQALLTIAVAMAKAR